MGIIYILLAGISYALFQILSSQAAPRLSNSWFIAIGAFSVFLFTAAIIIYRTVHGTAMGKISFSGALFIILANVAIALFSLYLQKSFVSFSPQFVIPLVFGIAIFTSSITGYIIQKQIPHPVEIISLILISGGLFLLSYQQIINTQYG